MIIAMILLQSSAEIEFREPISPSELHRNISSVCEGQSASIDVVTKNSVSKVSKVIINGTEKGGIADTLNRLMNANYIDNVSILTCWKDTDIIRSNWLIKYATTISPGVVNNKSIYFELNNSGIKVR